MAEGDDIVLLNGLLVTGCRREHTHGLLAHGIEVGKAVGVDEVVVGRLSSDGLDFFAELALDVRILREGPYGETKRRRRRLVAGNAANFLNNYSGADAAAAELQLNTYMSVKMCSYISVTSQRLLSC